MPAQTPQWQQDQQTESQVQQAVSFTGLPSIQSSVKNGVVTLTGTVRTEEDEARVSQSLVNVPGIKMVMNYLTIGRPVQAAAPAKATMLAAGTTIPIRLNGEIDTKTATAGDTFQGTVSANVLSGATVAIPNGTPVTGRVVAAKSAGRLSGAAELSLELVSLQLNGQSVAMTTRELSSKNNGVEPAPSRGPVEARHWARSSADSLAVARALVSVRPAAVRWAWDLTSFGQDSRSSFGRKP